MLSKTYSISTIVIPFLLTGFVVVGIFVPTGITWGFHALHFLSTPVRIVLISLALIVFSFVVTKSYTHFLDLISSFLDRKPYYFLTGILICYVICAITFQVKIPLLGDGFYFVKNFSESFKDWNLLDFRNEPLSVIYFFSFAKFLHVSSYGELLNAFLIASILIGTGFIIVVFYIIRNTFTNPVDRLLYLLLLLTIPYVQLFFGYVESYGFVLLSISLYVLLSILYLKKKLPFIFPVFAFLLTFLSHFLSLMILPSILFLGGIEWKKNGWKNVATTFGLILGIVLLLLIMINFDFVKFSGSVPHSHFLSFTKSTETIEQFSDAYTILSPYHGLDLFNFLFLLGGASLGLIIITILNNPLCLLKEVEGKFFISAAIPVICVLCILKFDLGLSRDWDVMSAYFFIIALSATWSFSQIDIPNSTTYISALIIITGLNTAAFIGVNSNPDTSIRRFESLSNPYTFSQFGYYSSSLTLSKYYHQIEDNQHPVEIWKRYIDIFPQDPKCYQNIITNAKYLGSDGFKLTDETFEQWFNISPMDSTLAKEYVRFCIDAGNSYFQKNSLAAAALYYKKALVFAPEYDRAYNNLGSVYAQQGKPDSAIICFQKAIDIDPRYSDPYYNLGNIQNERGDLKKAISYFSKAAELNNTKAMERLKQLQSSQKKIR